MIQKMIRLNEIYKGYVVVNTINNKKYIGITTTTLKQRWSLHVMASKYRDYKSALYNAMSKYGADKFSIHLMYNCNSWEKLVLWEKQTIIEQQTKVPNGYNITDGGEGSLGLVHTEEFKRNLSEMKIQFYIDPEQRKAQSERSIKAHNTPEALELSKQISTLLWKNPEYRTKTLKALEKSRTAEWRTITLNALEKSRTVTNEEKRIEAVIKATRDNPAWMEAIKIRNKELAKDPEWRKKVSDGLKTLYECPQKIKEMSQRQLKYWEEPHEERRKQHAKIMSETVRNNLQNPEYIKWRLENPLGGKPILYNFKYFRSIQEVVGYFKISRPTIDRHLLQNKDGCKKLDPTKQYKFEIQYK
jgi:group I intron endonuclease